MRNISILSRIFWIVCAIHVSFMLPLFFKSPVDHKKKIHRSIVVKTISTSPVLVAEKKNTPTIQHTSEKNATGHITKKQVVAGPSPAVKRTESTILKDTHKKVPLKKEIPKTHPVTNKKKISNSTTPPASSQPSPLESISLSLMQELQESIAKIQDQSDKQQKRAQGSASFSSPRTVSSSLQIDLPRSLQEEATIERGDYIQTLVEQLHASLHLPDIGEVKIELTLRQDGTVAKLKVLNAESQQNRKYLEAELPRLRFPYLSGLYALEKEHTFIFNFCNAS